LGKLSLGAKIAPLKVHQMAEQKGQKYLAIRREAENNRQAQTTKGVLIFEASLSLRS
jgi:hypothetical protein